jgi:CheY-like chemotaxis protein
MPLRRTVLIVEDDEDLRRVYRHALGLEGFDVHEARGGFEALRHLDQTRPDVIVLDLGLPGLDGFAVREELAGPAHLRDIPIVIVTGSTENLERLNVDCVLKKPAAPDELVQAVRRCLASGGALKPVDPAG